MQTREPTRETVATVRRGWTRAGATWWAWAVLAITIVVGIGGPLVGRGVFLGTDMLGLWSPWRADAPPGFRPANANVGDTVNSLVPLRDAFADRLRGGDVTLWTTLPGGGVPLGATPDLAVLSPLALPYLVTPIWYAPALTKAVEMAVAALFMALYLRRLGIGWFGGAVGGAIYMTSGFQIAWVNWPQTLVGATIPILFWAIERAIQERRVTAAIPVALATAVMFAGGFPAVAGWALLLAGAYSLIRCLLLPVTVPRRIGLLATLAAMVALGVGLMAIQLLSFAEGVDARGGLEYRDQEPGDHLPVGALATALVPDALGSYANDNYWGPRNNVETLSFLGVTAVVLAAIGFIGARRVRVPAGVRGVLWVSLAIALALTYLGGPILAAAQEGMPLLFDSNFIGRMRSIIGFLVAVLAGIGAHVVASTSLRPTRTEWRRAGFAVIVLGGVLAVVGWSAVDAAAYHDRLDALRDAVVAPTAVAGGLLVLLLLAVVLPSARLALIALVPVLVAVEALLVIRPLWPRIDRDEFYPVTAAHEFLRARLGQDRLVSDDRALEPGSTTYYGVRTVSAHLFHEPAWQRALQWVDPQAFHSPTFPKFTMPEDDPYRIAGSPIMDRLSARFYAVDPEKPLLGDSDPLPAADATIELAAGDTTSAVLPSGGTLRGIDVDVSMPSSGDSRTTAELALTITSSSGEPLAAGKRRIDDPPADGRLTIPLVETGVPAGSEVVIRLDSATGSIGLAADSSGAPAVAVVRSRDDGLRVAFTDGVVIYERLTALPRFRWASEAVVATTAAERLTLLEDPDLPGSQVVLSRPGPAADGRPGGVRLVRDSGDEMIIDAAAAGAGYVVVADALQRGWRAEVDGEPANVRAADQAVAAIWVPAGDHRITLWYEPPGWRLGVVVSAASAAALALLVALPRIRLASAIRQRRRCSKNPPENWGNGAVA